MTLESDVLKRIRPTPAQDRKVLEAVDDLSEKVLTEARRIKVHVEPMLVGSVAKGTHLKDPDIDLFMLFPESTTLEVLKEAGLEIGRTVLNGREHYAQHPYVRGEYGGFQVDLVPCFRIRDTRRKMSAVDRTPFHTEFVRKHLKKGMADQVRLLKRFMKGTECYGAEAKIQGFSGYLCELLVMRFGGFREVLESAKEWKVGQALDLPDYPGKEFDEAFTFVDPVDPSRNVASAVAPETLLRFILAGREYLASPENKFFFPNEREVWDSKRIKDVAGKRLDNIISIAFPKLDFIDDVVYPQLRKTITSVSALLERSDFSVEKTTIHVDDSTHLLVEVASMSLEKMRKHRGPPANSENATEFLAKWKSAGKPAPFIEDGRWYVMTERAFDRADDLVKAKLRNIPLGKDVMKQKSIEVSGGQKLLSEKHLPALTRHFDERMPWQR